MFRFLKRLLASARRDDEPVRAGAYVLMTRRVAAAAEPVPGFPETYYCSACDEYFVLGWRPEDAPAPGLERVYGVDLPESLQAGEALPVFCPRCRAPYPSYGSLPPGDASAPSMRCLDRFSVARPPDVGPRALSLMGMTVGRLVVVLSGELPADLPRESFILDYVAHGLGDAFATVASGGVFVDVLVTDVVLDDTAALTALLQHALDPGVDWGARVILSREPTTLRAPLKRIMLCLVSAS